MKQIPDLAEGLLYVMDLIKERLVLGGGQSVIVAVAGGSASGKTSQVAEKIKQEFKADAVIVSADDFYKGIEYMERANALGMDLNWDHPDMIDLELLREKVIALRDGKTVLIPRYDFKTGKSQSDKKSVAPARVIIVEGLFVLDDLIASIADVTVFVEVGLHGRLIRRLIRDTQRASWSITETFSYFATVVQPMHDEYIEATKQNADVIISNEYDAKKECRGQHDKQLKFQCYVSREELTRIGAEYVGASAQTDWYYSPPDLNLNETQELIRIREEKGGYTLTYKGPKTDADYCGRARIEFPISEPIARKFEEFYGKKLIKVTKNRQLYKLGDVTIARDPMVIKHTDDDSTNLGEFIEIRAIGKCKDKAEKISAVVEKLGLRVEDAIAKAYVEIA